MAAHCRADLVRGAPCRFALLVAISPPRVSSTGDPKCRDDARQADFTGRGVLFRLYQPRSVRIEAPPWWFILGASREAPYDPRHQDAVVVRFIVSFASRHRPARARDPGDANDIRGAESNHPHRRR